jgi:hypothetical protein
MVLRFVRYRNSVRCYFDNLLHKIRRVEMEYLQNVWIMIEGKLLVLALLTALDFVFGVTVSLLIKKDFKWVYLSHYLETDVLPIFAWVGVVLLATIPADLVPAGVVPVVDNVVYATIFLSILASVLGSFAEIGVLKAPLNKIGIG